MTLILLEALGAGLLLVLIVWWTMFSGRNRGEPQREVRDEPSAPEDNAGADPTASDSEKPTRQPPQS